MSTKETIESIGKFVGLILLIVGAISAAIGLALLLILLGI